MLYQVPDFPNSYFEPFQITSEKTPFYNCIAWAYGDATKWYWPNPIYYWPNNIPKEETINAFIELFRSIGFVKCDDGSLEKEFEKIAIFSKNDRPTHAAKQLRNGEWSSKLGRDHDVSHSISSIIGGVYGNVAVYMKRAVSFSKF